MSVAKIGAVVGFEWRRSLTLPRVLWWIVLTMFPVFLVTLVRISAPQNPPYTVWMGMLYTLLPALVCMLGTFLWTTTAVSAELERRSWVYIGTRPHGATAMLIGKWIAAITWVVPAALVGLTLAVFIASPGAGPAAGPANPAEAGAIRLWATLAGLILLSAPAYGALYLLLGAIFYKRAMVIAVVYTVIFEGVLGTVPAIVNKFTIQFRLRSLLVDWSGVDSTEVQSAGFVGDSAWWVHTAALFGAVVLLLCGAILTVRFSEYSAAAEAEV